MSKKLIPKFSIGDIVYMKDEFRFNRCEKTTSIGRIESIHLRYGNKLGYNPNILSKSKKLNDIIYSVSGFTIMPKESQIATYGEAKGDGDE